MPRVHYVKKARKAYPNQGIKKGEPYYWWKRRVTAGKSFRGILYRSKTRPRSSQLAGSEYLSSLYAAQEHLDDACEVYEKAVGPILSAVEDAGEAAREVGEKTEDEADELTDEHKAALESARDDLAGEFRSVSEEIRTLGEETRDKHSNLPEGLQQAPTGELLEQRADACDSLADALDTAADDIEGTEAAEITAELADEKKDECDFSEADQS